MRFARALLVLLPLLLAACSPAKLTEENVAKIGDGMTIEQVKAIVGPPTETQSGSILGITGASSVWKEGDATLAVQFVNDKVVLKVFRKGGQK
jgi:hypothetical protein